MGLISLYHLCLILTFLEFRESSHYRNHLPTPNKKGSPSQKCERFWPAFEIWDGRHSGWFYQGTAETFGKSHRDTGLHTLQWELVSQALSRVQGQSQEAPRPEGPEGQGQSDRQWTSLRQ